MALLSSRILKISDDKSLYNLSFFLPERPSQHADQQTAFGWSAPEGPQFRPIGKLDYQFLQFCLGQHPDWTAAELLRCASELEDAEQHGRQEDLQLWVHKLMSDGQSMGL